MATQTTDPYSSLWASAERHATALAQLADEVEALARRVAKHTNKMGFAWNLAPR